MIAALVIAGALVVPDGQSLLIREAVTCGLYGLIEYDGQRIKSRAVTPCGGQISIPVGPRPFLYDSRARVMLNDVRFFRDTFEG